MRTAAITFNTIRENTARLTMIFFTACIFLLVLYVVNVYSVISNTVSLRETESKIVAVNKEVGQLDAEYLALSSKITPDALNSYGMKAGQVTAYISKSESISRVAMALHEL